MTVRLIEFTICRETRLTTGRIIAPQCSAQWMYNIRPHWMGTYHCVRVHIALHSIIITHNRTEKPASLSLELRLSRASLRCTVKSPISTPLSACLPANIISRLLKRQVTTINLYFILCLFKRRIATLYIFVLFYIFEWNFFALDCWRSQLAITDVRQRLTHSRPRVVVIMTPSCYHTRTRWSDVMLAGSSHRDWRHNGRVLPHRDTHN